jgi:hypothetical protein
LFDGFVAASLAVRDGREPVFAARVDPTAGETPTAPAGSDDVVEPIPSA